MQKYLNFWGPVNFADMLEVSAILKALFQYRPITAIKCLDNNKAQPFV